MIFAIGNSVNWKYICCDSTVFTAARDVRYYSSPYDSGKDNRISIVRTDADSLLKLAENQKLNVLAPTKFAKKLQNSASPLLVGGGIGGIVLGPVGAAIGASLGAFIGSANNVKEEELRDVFQRCQRAALTWEDYDTRKLQNELVEKEKYLKLAISKWNKYYKLQSMSSIDNLTGFEFEVSLLRMYKNLGFEANLTKGGSDWGVDIIAKKDNSIYAIQAKRYNSPVGTQAVQEIFSGAKYYNANNAVLVTNSRFTDSAIHLAKKLEVSLVDRIKLVSLWSNAFPQQKIPEFKISEYEKLKQQIDIELKSIG
jgi:hypothetical protein